MVGGEFDDKVGDTTNAEVDIDVGEDRDADGGEEESCGDGDGGDNDNAGDDKEEAELTVFTTFAEVLWIVIPLSLPVLGTCGPRHRSTSGPHLYRVIRCMCLVVTHTFYFCVLR